MKQLFLITILCFSINCFGQDLNDFNGWEFLEWDLSKKDVEQKLRSKGIKYDPGHPNQIQGPTTEFEHEGLQTRLAYDVPGLYDIQQNKYFTDRKSADTFFRKIKTLLKKKYGEPELEKDDIKEEVYLMEWKLLYTKIYFAYSYDDEFLPGYEDYNYTIYIHFNPY